MTPLRTRLTAATAAAALAGCASSGPLAGEAWLENGGDPRPAPARPAAAQTLGEEAAQPETADAEVSRRTIPAIRDSRSGRAADPDETPPLPSDAVNVTLPPQPLPSFINTVFGEILEQPFTLGPNISERDELISLRSVNDMRRDTFLSLVEEALKDYGVGVLYENGLFRIIELEELRREMPRFITSRARSDVPSGLRPVVQFIELTAIDAADMEQILRQAFPDSNAVNVRTNRRTNSLVVSGLAEDVNAAVAIIEEMDELRFAGTQVVTFTPRNWQAEELAETMLEILTLEGYFASIGTTTPRALSLLPIEFTNQLMIFAADRQLADHALSVGQRLDMEAFRSEARRAHVYQVKNGAAENLAGIVGAVIGAGGGERSDGAASQSGEASGGGSDGEDASVQSFGDLTVDEQGNRIIFFGTSQEFEEVSTLLDELDTPVAEVMIEVTIAEITLTDDATYGLDVAFDSDAISGFRAQLNSQNGFTGVVNTGQISLSGSADASNNQINILSVPRVVTRSGQEASIQVGTDVPVITSQRASPVQEVGTTDILQTVEFRSTGILLSVEPLVYSGDRIDLTISQEVSSAQNNPNPAIASPVISNRSLTSQLSLQDGQTAVLGGLIDNQLTRGNTGVPFVKDIPVIGSAFRSETISSQRTMLLVLVTPYVLNTRDDRQAFVDALTGGVNTAFQNQTSARRTLIGPSEPMQIRARSAQPDAER